jgi:asparagine synthase (glutamine-hydrolysing)
MGLDIQSYLPDDLLKMGDRMSMANSLELRVPFCDNKLLAFALQVPYKTRLKGMKLKGFIREALEPVLPDQTLKGPKRGFMVPLARWLRENLHDMVHDLLSETRIIERGYMNPAYVSWLIAEHESGRRNFADQIYALLTLEIWLCQRQSEMKDDLII